jgi:hypothetical protein
MGLFDTIHCNINLLPVEPPQVVIDRWKSIEKIGFQTKDLGCTLSQYKIDEGGQLWRLETETEWDTSAPQETKEFDFLHPRSRVIKEEWVQDNRTCTVEFYESIPPEKGESFDLDGWIEYRAYIVRGKVDSIELVKNDPPRNFTQKELDEQSKMREEMKKLQDKRNQKLLNELGEYRNQLVALRNTQEWIFQCAVNKFSDKLYCQKNTAIVAIRNYILSEPKDENIIRNYLNKQPEFLTMEYSQFENYLLERYPALFHVSEITGKPYCQCGISCPPGWRSIVDELCTHIVRLFSERQNANIKICQIKEKFASLRIYYDGQDEVIEELIDFTCLVCEDICRETGRFGATVYDNRGWLQNLCPEMIEKQKEKDK